MTLKEYRERRGLSQRDLAEEVGVTRRTVIRWENGETCIPTGRLAPLACTLRITYDQLLQAIGRLQAKTALRLPADG